MNVNVDTAEKLTEQKTSKPKTVALIGNPNTGKTTLFNRLTGARQRVGNYPGVTVEKREGKMLLGGEVINVVDLPGTYSLSASSPDERVVVDYLAGRISETDRPDLVVCVVDSTNLTRNLYLASQVADAHCPIILALNFSDEIRLKGIEIDYDELSARLGVAVVPTVASRGEGVKDLQKEIEQSFRSPRMMKRITWSSEICKCLDLLKRELALPSSEELADTEIQRLLFNPRSAVTERLNVSQEKLRRILDTTQELLSNETGVDPAQVEPLLRYKWLAQETVGLVNQEGESKAAFSDSLDRILTDRFFGFGIFLGVMYLVFQSIYTFAGPFMDFIDTFFASLGAAVGGYLESTPMLKSLVVDGVIAGVGGVVIFLPQILILFLFIALLEDSGYMARAAFLMDKVFGWCGLSGKSFVPLLSSYACAIPGVMAARTIEEPRSRLVTILIAPLMSCSARLPVYVLLIGAFIEPTWGSAWAGFVLFAMHFLGLLVAIPIAYAFNLFFSRATTTPFILEMPPYRIPSLRDVLWRMWERGKLFLLRAGTVILCMSVIIWALCYFPHSNNVATELRESSLQAYAAEQNVDIAQAEEYFESEEGKAALEHATAGAYLEQSYMGQLGKFVQPVFAPAGFDWKITVGVLASFPAREVIISTLGIIYNLGGEVDEESSELVSAMKRSAWDDGRAVYSPLIAIGIMVFFALCMQCGATVAVIARESNWGWAIFAFTYMTALAWLGAVLVYQVGSNFVL